MESKKRFILLCLVVSISAVTLAGYTYFSPSATNCKWDKDSNWSYVDEATQQWVYPMRIPDDSNDVFLYWTNPAGPYDIDNPCWIRTWQQQGYPTDPGAEADAICNQIWLYGPTGSANMLIEGDLTVLGNFIMGAWDSLTSHNEIYIADTATINTGGFFTTNSNADSEYIFTLDGGHVEDLGNYSIYNAQVYWYLNDGHLGVAGNFSTEANPDELVLNFVGPGADVVLLTTELNDNLIPGGCIQAQGTTVTAANRDTLLSVFDVGGGYSAVLLAGADSGKARSPYPADVGIGDLTTDLTWRAPLDVNDADWTYEVYVDVDSDFTGITPITVGPFPGEYRGSVSNASIGGPLAMGDYFWRVDAIEPNALGDITHTGDVWTFNARPLPELIAPQNVPHSLYLLVDSADLQWSSDPVVDHSRVIITPEGQSPIDCGVQSSPFDLYAFSLAHPEIITLEWGTEYTWQVIEEDASDIILAEGDLWTFDIRPVSCDTSVVTADLTGDCIVNLADFAVMAGQWLNCGWDDGGYSSPCP